MQGGGGPINSPPVQGERTVRYCGSGPPHCTRQCRKSLVQLDIYGQLQDSSLYSAKTHNYVHEATFNNISTVLKIQRQKGSTTSSDRVLGRLPARRTTSTKDTTSMAYDLLSNANLARVSRRAEKKSCRRISCREIIYQCSEPRCTRQLPTLFAGTMDIVLVVLVAQVEKSGVKIPRH